MLEGETENVCVLTKNRGSLNAVVLMATRLYDVKKKGKLDLGSTKSFSRPILLGSFLSFLSSIPVPRNGMLKSGDLVAREREQRGGMYSRWAGGQQGYG